MAARPAVILPEALACGSTHATDDRHGSADRAERPSGPFARVPQYTDI
jgi:hypothetical protein